MEPIVSIEYCIVSPVTGIIENMIVCDGDDSAAAFGALPSYDGAVIGEIYAPPPSELEQLRADVDFLAALQGVAL